MSKTIEEIRAEMATAAAALAPAAPPVEVLEEQPDAAAPAAALSVPELLERLAAASGVSLEKLLAGLDAATGGSGEEVQLLPEGTRTYYATVRNSGIMVQVGPAQCERIEFKGDTLHTTDPAVIEYLDRIVDKPGSGVYSRSHVHVSQEVQQMRNELAAMAAAHHAKLVAAGEKTS